jgi:hypothetical protein
MSTTAMSAKSNVKVASCLPPGVAVGRQGSDLQPKDRWPSRLLPAGCEPRAPRVEGPAHVASLVRLQRSCQIPVGGWATFLLPILAERDFSDPVPPPRRRHVGAPATGGRGHFQPQSPLHILGQFSAIPEPSIGSAGTRRQRCSAWAFGSDPSLPPTNTQAQDAMSIEGLAPRSPLIDRALSVGRVP